MNARAWRWFISSYDSGVWPPVPTASLRVKVQACVTIIAFPRAPTPELVGALPIPLITFRLRRRLPAVLDWKLGDLPGSPGISGIDFLRRYSLTPSRVTGRSKFNGVGFVKVVEIGTSAGLGFRGQRDFPGKVVIAETTL